jgi:hypothetical protein
MTERRRGGAAMFGSGRVRLRWNRMADPLSNAERARLRRLIKAATPAYVARHRTARMQVVVSPERVCHLAPPGDHETLCHQPGSGIGGWARDERPWEQVPRGERCRLCAAAATPA